MTMSSRLATRVLLTVTLLLLASLVQAKDLGVMGETYSIREIDLMTFIQSRISELQNNGQWQVIENDMQQRAIRYRDRPTAVIGITKADSHKTWLFDPSVVLDRDIYSPDGQRIASAGTRVNPLLKITLSKTLIFFDGDDVDQVKWVAKQDKALHGRTKLILVNGSLLSQEKQLKKPIYFDQSGRLITRFGIRHVPAVVSQEGVQLRIREVKI